MDSHLLLRIERVERLSGRRVSEDQHRQIPLERRAISAK